MNFIHGGKLVVYAINILDGQNHASSFGEKTELTTLIRWKMIEMLLKSLSTLLVSVDEVNTHLCKEMAYSSLIMICKNIIIKDKGIIW